MTRVHPQQGLSAEAIAEDAVEAYASSGIRQSVYHGVVIAPSDKDFAMRVGQEIDKQCRKRQMSTGTPSIKIESGTVTVSLN